MKPCKVIVHQGMGTIKKSDINDDIGLYPAPGIPDGEHFCVLQWQLLDDPTGNWFNIDNPQNWKDSTTRKIWTLVASEMKQKHTYECPSSDSTTEHFMNNQNNKGMETVEEEPFEYFSLETLKRICQSLRQETRPIKGHNDTGAIQDCWNTVNDILPLLFLKDEVKRIAYRSAELGATAHLTPNLDQIIENRGYVVDKPKDHEFSAQWAKQQSDGDIYKQALEKILNDDGKSYRSNGNHFAAIKEICRDALATPPPAK